jgi:hypothetical protein
VAFSLQGDGTPTSAEAVFALPDQSTFVAGSTLAPAGWTCAATDTTMRRIRCTTDSLDRGSLAFKLGVSMPAKANSGTLNYLFGGQNIVTKTFANQYG